MGRTVPGRRRLFGPGQWPAGHPAAQVQFGCGPVHGRRYALAAEQFAYLEALLPHRKGLREDREGLCGLFNTVEAPPLHAYYILSLYFSGERERAMRAFDGLKREKKRGTDTLIGLYAGALSGLRPGRGLRSLEKKSRGTENGRRAA